MRSVIAGLMALLFTCGVAFAQADSSSSTGTSSTGISMSTGTEQGGATGGAMTGEEKMITGEVKNVNKDQKQITITGPEGNQVVYTLSNDTQITTRTGETMKIGDLKSGSKVTITYTGTGESAQVKKVEVQQGK